MDVNVTKISDEGDFCYSYMIIWYRDNYRIITGKPSRRSFASKKEAMVFARDERKKYMNVLVKPIIIRHVVMRSAFSKNTTVEPVNISEREYINYCSYGCISEAHKDKIILY